MEKLNQFHQNLALAWASANYADWLRTHPDADASARVSAFYDWVESGLTVAIQFSNENSFELV